MLCYAIFRPCLLTGAMVLVPVSTPSYKDTSLQPLTLFEGHFVWADLEAVSSLLLGLRLCPAAHPIISIRFITRGNRCVVNSNKVCWDAVAPPQLP